MTINISFERVKKGVGVALIATNLFSFGVAASYVWWRHKTDAGFALLQFDLHDRFPAIRARMLQKQAEEAAKAVRDVQEPPPTK